MLFKENCEGIIGQRIVPAQQPSGGSYHSMKDLEALRSQLSFQWSDNIADVLERYQAYKGL